jgi:hypothetical protein
MRGKQAETRSASRSKMRTAHPRRARDGWTGPPRSELANVRFARFIINQKDILGVEGGRFERPPGGSLNPLRDGTDGWRRMMASHAALSARSKTALRLRLCRLGSNHRSSAEYGRGVGEDRLASCTVGATVAAEARGLTVGVQPPTRGLSTRSAPNRTSPRVGGARDSSHSGTANSPLLSPCPLSFNDPRFPVKALFYFPHLDGLRGRGRG